MKTAFIYYSHEGNCRALSGAMARETGGDTEELRLAGGGVPTGFAGKYFVGGKGSILKETPPLQPLSIEPADYDLLVVGGPVWAFNMAPAVRSFLTSTDWNGRRAALFVMHRGGKGVALRSMSRLIGERGGVVVGAADFTDLRRGDVEATTARAVAWIAETAKRLEE